MPKEEKMESKRFTRIDEGFTCAWCGLEVKPLGRTCRNHCPRCLCSLHLDVNPGDRASGCGGLMKPIAVETDPRRGYIVVHRCETCGAIRRNKAAHDAPDQPDDIRLLIDLTNPDYRYSFPKAGGSDT